MKNRRGFQVALALVGAVLVGAACDSSTEPEIVIPTIPTLPPAPPATILVYNDFNGENGGQGVNNFTQLANWNVTGGCVDLHGNGFVDVQAGHGIYIDLDGTCLTGGTIESKTAFDLAPGNYTFEFWLAGNQRIDAPDTAQQHRHEQQEQEHGDAQGDGEDAEIGRDDAVDIDGSVLQTVGRV